jgi:hypothetical protein
MQPEGGADVKSMTETIRQMTVTEAAQLQADIAAGRYRYPVCGRAVFYSRAAGAMVCPSRGWSGHIDECERVEVTE